MVTQPHRLTEKDTEARTGVCSVDGPVKIRKSGTGWACAVRANAAARASKKRNPSRRRSSDAPHRLTWFDAETRTGTCPVDGAVEIVPWGGGYVCRNRATELGVTNPQAEVQRHCKDCVSDDHTFMWLDADGNCPRCSQQSLNAGFAEMFDLAAEKRRFFEWAGIDIDPADPDGGWIFATPGDPYAMPEYESAVAGWKTLG